MLRKLTVENFYSIAEKQVFDLSVAKNATDPDGRFAKPIEKSEERFAKVAALFGANASGKTTLLRALAFLRYFCRESEILRPGDPIPFLPFRRDTKWSQPTRLSVEFDAELVEGVGRCEYRYHLSLFGKEYRVLEEWLEYLPLGKPRLLFRREGNEIEAGADFDLSKRDPVRERIKRGNASILSMLAKFSHPLSVKIYEGLLSVSTNIDVTGDRWESNRDTIDKYYFDNSSVRDGLLRVVKKLDFGITEINFEQDNSGKRIPTFRHSGLDTVLLFDFESGGTKRLYNLYPLLYFALRAGGLAVIDEIDNDIHPLILPEIIRLFQSKETNKHDAQLIFSCHNATLLEHLVKEEVFFTEKDEQGRTQVYRLKEIQGARRDANIYAKYLAGTYGAVPRIA